MSSFARATDGLRLGSGRSVVTFVRDLPRGGRHVVSAAALAAFLVLPLGLTDGGYFGRAIPAMTVALAAAAGLAALSAPAREMPRGLVATVLALVALTALVGLSSLWAVPGAAVEFETRRCVLYVVALLAVSRIVDRRAGPPFLLALTSTIAMVAVVGVGIRAASGIPVDPYYGGLLAEPVGYPNAVGVLAAMGALLAIGLAARFEAAARALHATASVLVLVLGLSGSRGGALALVGGIIVLLALSPRGDRWPCVGRAASALAVGGCAWVVTSALGGSGPPLVIAAAGAATIGAAVPTPGRRGALALLCGLTLAIGVVAVTHPPSTTSSYRTAYWAAAAAESRERPLLGSGAGSFFLSWREHRTAQTDVRDAHSLYVETLSELGPLGLALVLVVIGAPLGAAVRRRGDPIAAAAGAAFASFALHAGLDWDWEMPVVTLVALGCAGALLTRRPLGGTTHS